MNLTSRHACCFLLVVSFLSLSVRVSEMGIFKNPKVGIGRAA